MIELKNVHKTYKNGASVLHDVNLTIEQGEFVYVVGPTGAGKSTIIKLLTSEELPTKGTVNVLNISVGKLRHSKVPKYRRNIGVVYQDFRLLKEKTVFENVAYALEVIGTEGKEVRRRVRAVLNMVGLDDKGHSKPEQLSGGEQQRVAIARAIINNPKVLIADEPTGNLDPVMSDEIIALLDRIKKDLNTTIIMVTHDYRIVNRHRRRTVTLESGHIVADMMEGGYYARVKVDS